MAWNIPFISESDFREHVRLTIAHYREKLQPYNVKKFNSNSIDPVKMIFDKAVYGQNWDGIIASEIFRQRDKSNTNEIGYFHQRMFDYIDYCHVPPNGEEGGWDVIFDVPEGYELENGDTVHVIYVEVKNKHNTMNSAAGSKTYIKMQAQLLEDDDCACFLVEAIAKRSQDVMWETTVDKKKVAHARIRRVSIDRFYQIVTGLDDAFLRICLALPQTVEDVLAEQKKELKIPHDSVAYEMRCRARKFKDMPDDMAMIMAMYMLGFNSYNGFARVISGVEKTEFSESNSFEKDEGFSVDMKLAEGFRLFV